MGKMGRTDKLLLATLLPLWIVCLAFHVKEVVRTGFAEPPIYAAPAANSGGHPTVGGFRRERGRGGDELQVGDRLLRIGDTDLRGVGYFGFDAIALDEAGTAMKAPLVFERDGTQHTVSFEMLSSGFPWYRVVPILSWVVVCSLILIRAAGSMRSRLLFAACLSIAILETQFYGGPRWQSYAALAIFNSMGGIAFVLVLRWAIHFPYEVPENARLSPAWSWLGLLWYVVRFSYYWGGPVPPERVPVLTLTLDALLLLGALGIVSYNFRNADPIGRRRFKWLLLSGYLGIAPLGLTALIPVLSPGFQHFDVLFEIGVMLFVVVPVGLFIGIMRYNLYDIDRLISVTASYSALGVILLATMLTVLPRVAEAASGFVGIEASTCQTVFSVVLALLVVQANRRVRPQIERLFFRERYAIEQGIDDILRDLSGCSDPTALAQLAGERLDSVLRPESTIIYARNGDLYEPVFAHGQALPPAFEGSSPLIAALEKRHGPLTAEAVVENRRNVELSPFDRAALDTLGVPLVLPVRREEDLIGFICLGPKRSGDVYTSTDVALLTAVSDKVSSELLRFGQDEMLEAGQAMQESLRRYVPGAVAEQLEAGQNLEAGERDVAVLFVDLRRYTTYSESRGAEEIFSTVNRYTDAVSRAVRNLGGSVVEFNGDGMMTVFGAPTPLADKERRAVQAAREIVVAVDQLARETPAAPGTPPLSVGAGIATGPAFVGNIQAVDRMIWTAIGNTVNLAARLQQLTRDLDAAVVVDEQTWSAARREADGWVQHRRTMIRGRTDSVDVYSLPLRVQSEQSAVGPADGTAASPPG
jgi:class 3 adenylate cyclase